MSSKAQTSGAALHPIQLHAVRDEIVGLHHFFQDWFTGALPQTEEAFARMRNALAADFAIISPGGVLTERAALLQNLFRAHGQQPHMRIWIERVQIRQQVGELVVATYEEWQSSGEQPANPPTARLSTALFRRRDENNHALEWLHVHETWLP